MINANMSVAGKMGAQDEFREEILMAEMTKTMGKARGGTTTKNLVLAALFLALGLVLPFFTAQIPSIGSMLLPMHIPVLICGFVCGGPYGLLVGAIVPLLRSVMFGMPPMLVAIPMAFELAAYGFMTGFLYKKLKKNTVNIYVSLLAAMIIGRIVWGVVKLVMAGMGTSSFGMAMFISGAFTTAIPGIILQIVLIPIIVIALRKASLID